MDKDWLRAYAVVRFKQPRLYKKGERFFKDTAKPVTKKKEKTTTLKDHERKFILEKGGIDEDVKPNLIGKSYLEEQEEIKQSLKAAIGDSSGDESSEEEDLLVRAHKTESQRQREENEYLEWLKGEKDSLGDPDAEAELAPLKQYWNDPSLDEKEKVLRDYVLNNGYMDQEDSASDSASDEDEVKFKEGPDRDEEERFLREAEKYEHQYNFRHEEPGGEEIKSYPRVIETSVRTKDTRRADKRKQKLEHKKKAKEKMKDEIRLLQKLQMEEKMEKLENLRRIAHRPDLDYDLDADFDPDEHNKIMKKYFDDDNYDKDEDADQKPTFDYDAAIDEEEDEWWRERLQEEAGGDEEAVSGRQEDEEGDPDADDPHFSMDADYDPTQDYKAKKKRAKRYGKALAKRLPVFDPTTKTFDEYIDEYLKDKINDLPFTYRKVTPNDYGLTTEEILSLPDKELNAWVSVKKMSQYRTSREEMEECRRYQARAKDIEKKKKILPSLFKEQEENPEAHSKKKKKKRKGKVDGEDNEEGSADPPPSSSVSDSFDSMLGKSSDKQDSLKLKKKKERKRKVDDEDNEEGSADSLPPSSLSGPEPDPLNSMLGNSLDNQDSLKLKKKKKRKRKIDDEDNEEGSTAAPPMKKLQQSSSLSGPGPDLFDSMLGNSLDNQDSLKLKKKKKSKGIEWSKTSDAMTATEKVLATNDVSQLKLNQRRMKKMRKIDKKSASGSPVQPKGDKKVKRFKWSSTANERATVTISGNSVIVTMPRVDGQSNNTIVTMPRADGQSNITSHAVNQSQMKRKKRSADEGKRKKKQSIKMNKKLRDGEEASADSKSLKRQLSKFMSVSRLNKYGLGPNSAQEARKKRKRKTIK